MDKSEETDSLKKLWEQKSDEDLITASSMLSDFTETTRTVILNEVSRRGLNVAPDIVGKAKEITGYEPTGIKGWLLFFCIILTVLNPLVRLGILLVDFEALSAVLELAITGFGFYAGLSLWQKRQRAVHIAKKYLVVSLIYSFVVGVLMFMAGHSGSAFRTLFQSILFFGIWYTYLEQSRRVKNTFASVDLQNDEGQPQ